MEEFISSLDLYWRKRAVEKWERVEGEATGKSGKGKERKEPENNQSRKKASTALHGAEKAPHPAPLPVAFSSALLLV